MPTDKDFQFAKILIAKQLISRVEMQRLLDELDDARKKGSQLTMEQLAVKEEIITPAELKILQAPKRRMVHCSKCRTIYRITDEDVGKRFKCKKCGVMVGVPRPGETQSKQIKELIHKKEEKNVESIDSRKILKTMLESGQVESHDESPIIVGEDMVGAAAPAKNVAHVKAKSYSALRAQEEPPEVTIELDVDDEIEEDDEDDIHMVSPNLEILPQFCA